MQTRISTLKSQVEPTILAWYLPKTYMQYIVLLKVILSYFPNQSPNRSHVECNVNCHHPGLVGEYIRHVQARTIYETPVLLAIGTHECVAVQHIHADINEEFISSFSEVAPVPLVYLFHQYHRFLESIKLDTTAHKARHITLQDGSWGFDVPVGTALHQYTTVGYKTLSLQYYTKTPTHIYSSSFLSWTPSDSLTDFTWSTSICGVRSSLVYCYVLVREIEQHRSTYPNASVQLRFPFVRAFLESRHATDRNQLYAIYQACLLFLKTKLVSSQDAKNLGSTPSVSLDDTHALLALSVDPTIQEREEEEAERRAVEQKLHQERVEEEEKEEVATSFCYETPKRSSRSSSSSVSDERKRKQRTPNAPVKKPRKIDRCEPAK